MEIEIIICEACNGVGEIERQELTNYHRHEYREWKEKCRQCKGHGRLKKKTTVIYQRMDGTNVT